MCVSGGRRRRRKKKKTDATDLVKKNMMRGKKPCKMPEEKKQLNGAYKRSQTKIQMLSRQYTQTRTPSESTPLFRYSD